MYIVDKWGRRGGLPDIGRGVYFPPTPQPCLKIVDIILTYFQGVYVYSFWNSYFCPPPFLIYILSPTEIYYNDFQHFLCNFVYFKSRKKYAYFFPSGQQLFIPPPFLYPLSIIYFPQPVIWPYLYPSFAEQIGFFFQPRKREHSLVLNIHYFYLSDPNYEGVLTTGHSCRLKWG